MIYIMSRTPEIDTELMSIFENLIEFIKNPCACAIDRNYKNDLTNETERCPINCCYTATSLAILMRLYLLNDDIYILEFPKKIIFPITSDQSIVNPLTSESTTIESLTTKPICSTFLRETYDSDKFFLGIVNTIGLLWDAHDELRPPFNQCGLMFALNNHELKSVWFEDNITITQGINMFSFYGEDEGYNIITHNSFIYRHNDLCYLIDSWRGNLYNTVTDFERFNRDLQIRIYPTNFLQDNINEINNTENRNKKFIFTSIFLAPNGKANSYNSWRIIKMNNNILDQKIIEGFSYSTCLFGGNNHKQKYFKYKQKYLNLKNYLHKNKLIIK